MLNLETLSTAIALLLTISGAHAQSCPTPKAPAKGAVVATVAGQKITMAALDAELGEALCQAQIEHAQKLAELRAAGLERLIDARLLAAEAKAKGANPEGLVQAVVAGVAPPTEAQMRALYDDNKDRLEGKSFEAVQADIREFLVQQARQDAVRGLASALRAKHAVSITLEPFRLVVPKGAVSRGPKDAPVTIVEFADYECPFCARATPAVKAVMARYGDKIRFEFRDFPLEFHPRAVPAAVAARCAGRQDKFWPMHDKLFENPRALQDADLSGYAQEVGLDLAAFAKCQADPTVRKAVAQDEAVGRSLGVSGTPAFFINGVPLTGAQPLEAFVPIIDRELARP